MTPKLWLALGVLACVLLVSFVQASSWMRRRRERAIEEKTAHVNAWASTLRERWVTLGASGSYPDAPVAAWIVATRRMEPDRAWTCLGWLATSAARMPDDLREAAIEEVIKRFRRRAPELLASLLADPAERIKVAAIVHLGRLRHRPLADAVVAALPRLGAGGRHAVARALSRMGAVEHEGTLIRLLADESRRVRDAAAESLGWIGTIAAVEPLTAHGGESAERAIGRIQARARGDAGRVSIAASGDEDARGRLSRAEHAGALSVTGKK